MLQIFLIPLLMIGQNVETRKSEAKVEADFARIIQVERQIEQILLHLDSCNQQFRDLIERHEAEHREMLYPVAQVRQLMTSTLVQRCHEDSLCESPHKLLI
jgi:uncharacterized membrane protein